MFATSKHEIASSTIYMRHSQDSHSTAEGTYKANRWHNFVKDSYPQVSSFIWQVLG